MRIGLTRAYIALLCLIAGLWLVAALGALEQVSRADLAIGILFAAWVAVANRFPIHFAFKSNIILDTAVTYAAVLTLEPGLAMLVVLSGTLIGLCLRQADLEESAFNISQATLQAGAAGALLALLNWPGLGAAFAFPADLPALLLAAVAIYATNTVLVSIVISLQAGGSPVHIWLQTATRHDVIEQFTQFVLGLFAAIVAQQQAWALPLLAAPMLLVHTSLVRQFRLRNQTIAAVEELANLIDLRDSFTANHSRRVAVIARLLATELGLPPNEIETIERAARVHDLGKVIIDVSVITKPEPLSAEEWALFKQHPTWGVEMLRRFPDFADGIGYVRSHHERIDGRGYPDGLNADELSLGARVLAVADGFDAMASARPYRPALPPERVLDELRKGRCTQWDPAVVDALLELIERERIALDPTSATPIFRDRLGMVEALERPGG